MHSSELFVPMQTHYTITRFGFRARRIDGVECGLFSNHAPLGQTTLRGEVRVTVCVTDCVMWSNCVVWDDDERKGEGETRRRLIACSSRKAPRGPPGLTFPSDGRIAINSIICLLNIGLHTAEEFGI